MEQLPLNERCFCLPFVSFINTMVESNLRKKGFIWLTGYNPYQEKPEQERKAGSWRQELMQCLAHFLIQPRSTFPEVVLPTVG